MVKCSHSFLFKKFIAKNWILFILISFYIFYLKSKFPQLEGLTHWKFLRIKCFYILLEGYYIRGNTVIKSDICWWWSTRHQLEKKTLSDLIAMNSQLVEIAEFWNWTKKDLVEINSKIKFTPGNVTCSLS